MPDFPSAVASLEPLPQYSEQDFLDLFNRLLPSHYIEPLKDPGPGYELLQAYAAVAARLSEAVEHVGTGNYILSAGEGAYSEGTVEFFRDNTVFGAVQLLAGTIIASPDGYTYQTLDDVTFEAGDLGPVSVTVRATVRGWLFNKPGPIMTLSGAVIPGTVNLLIRPLVPEPSTGYSFDPTLQLRQTSDITGGSAPMLQGLGGDRGLPPVDGESIEDYRARLTQLPDTVTPNALQSQFQKSTGATADIFFSARYWFIECWDLRFQMCWDAPYNKTVTPTSTYAQEAPVNTRITNFTQNVFVWDYDPYDVPADTLKLAPYGWPVSNRLMAAGAYSSSLILCVRSNFNHPLIQAAAQSLQAIKPAGVQIFYIKYNIQGP